MAYDDCKRFSDPDKLCTCANCLEAEKRKGQCENDMCPMHSTGGCELINLDMQQTCPKHSSISPTTFWYRRGKKVGRQQNPSGCTCEFGTDGESIISPCVAHKEWAKAWNCPYYPCGDIYKKGGDEVACQECGWEDQIPWNQLSYDYVARDEDGDWYEFVVPPIMTGTFWTSTHAIYYDDDKLILKPMPDGPKDWRDSVAVRPGK